MVKINRKLSKSSTEMTISQKNNWKNFKYDFYFDSADSASFV